MAGRNIHVYCDYQQPIQIDDHAHTHAQLSILFDPASCRVRWLDAAKNDTWNEQVFVGPRIYMVGVGQRHANIWEREADLLEIYLPSRWLKRCLGKRFPSGVMIFDPADAGSQDFVIWQLASVLLRLGREDVPDMKIIEPVATALSFRFCQLVNSNSGKEIVQAGGISRSRLKVVRDFVKANLHTSIRVSQLAQKIGLSVPHFAEVFKTTTGRTPNEFVTDCRMMRAHELLLSGEYRLGETARAVGYQDQGHFSEKFKDSFGYWPRFLLKHTYAKPEKRPKKS